MFNHYLTTAFRNFRRHWVTTIVNVVGLALGLACFIGALSAVKYYELDDSHYAGSDRSFFVMTESADMGAPGSPLRKPRAPWIMADLLKAQVPNDGVARVSHPFTQVISVQGSIAEVRASYVDAEFFKLFPLPFSFGERATALSQPRSAVIDESTAQRLFGRRDVIGQTLLLDGVESVTIVGVTSAPPQPSHIGLSETTSVLAFEVLVSMDMMRTMMRHAAPDRLVAEAAQNDPEFSGDLIESSLRSWTNNDGALAPLTYIRLKDPGATTLDSLNTVLAAQDKLHPSSDNRRHVAYPLVELRDHLLSSRLPDTGLSWQSFLVLISGVVLLASCLNYANLSAANLLARRKELGVRRVIGANTRQLTLQSLTESVILTCTAAILSLAVLLAFRPIGIAAFDLDVTYAGLHGAVWPITVSVMALVCLIVTAYPAVVIRRSQMAAALRQERGDTAKRSAASWLVATQFMLASVLLIGVFILRTQHEAIRRYALDTLPDPVLTIDNNLRAVGVDFETLRSELLKRPGVMAVTGTSYTPWGQAFDVIPISTALSPDARSFSVMGVNVAQNYFSTLQITPIAGQVFDDIGEAFRFDRNIRSVIDRSLARQLGYSDPAEAIGKVIYPGPTLKVLRDAGVSLHVIGVVEDKPWQFSSNGAVGSVFQRPMGHGLTPIIRLEKARLAEGLAGIDATWKQLAPKHVLHRMFLDERIEKYVSERNFSVRVITWITGLSILIALSGLIGMSVHMANRRRHEIGVRKTLGARTAQVTALLLRDFAKPVLIGNLVAWPLAYLLTQEYLNQFAHRAGFSPVPFALGLAATLAVAGTAVSWLAIRAARLNPANVLRHE